jgi:cyclophilin family peptidyl-prolyl cis-trans isomerase
MDRTPSYSPAAMTDRRQRQRESREERRREEERRKRIRAAWKRAAIFGSLALLIIGVFFVINVLSKREPELPAAYIAFRQLPVACDAEAPPEITPKSFPDGPEDLGLPPDAPITATMTTSCGEIVIELDPTLAPQGVNSFVFLANEGFYDGTVFHRIIDTFVARGGDPQADGKGGPGYGLPIEEPPDGFVYEPGVMALGHEYGSPTGSQFFFVVGPDAQSLGPDYSVLGTVVEGDDTLERIAAIPVQPAPSGERSLPREAVYVENVTVESS